MSDRGGRDDDSPGLLKCRAHSKRTGKPCNRQPRPGGVVCSLHGGNTPLAIAGAERRVAEHTMRLAFGRLGEHATPVDDPFTALAQVAGEVVAWKEFCAERIAELETLRTLDDKNAEQTHALIQLFERALDRCVQTLATIAKLNIDERLTKISERQGDALVVLLRAVLADPQLALTPEQRQAVPDVTRRHLKSVAG